MTPVTTFAGKTVALFGLGGSGLATARALEAGGADVVACDDQPLRMEAARAEGLGTGDLREADWSRFSALVLAPGVPLTHPAPHWTVGLAKAAGVEIIGDIELFCRERRKLAPDAPFVAITGTNGKSTTTALIAHVLRQAGHDVQMGGNIGTAILSLAPPAAGRIHVIELSTFQIDLAPSLDPSIGVLLNLTPDHLDRHGTMEAYAAIKERVVASSERAFVSVDDDYCAAIHARHTEPRVFARQGLITTAMTSVHPVSVRQPLDPGICLDGSQVVVHHRSGGSRVLCDLAGVENLRGLHNAQNACFAAAVAEAVGIAPDDDGEETRRRIQAGMESFPGLAHRMELLGRRGKVLFVNDSKATNADSTEKALSSFDDIHWIVGGKAKEGGIAPLAPLFPRVAHAYLVGASTEAFAATLEGRLPFTRCGTLDVATAKAAEAAAASPASEPVVLLSPACASYDQFPNFEVRGDRFRELVAALP